MEVPSWGARGDGPDPFWGQIPSDEARGERRVRDIERQGEAAPKSDFWAGAAGPTQDSGPTIVARAA